MSAFPPWPTAILRGASEADVAGQLAILVEHLGPLPQAEWVEPWGPDDPDGWEVRVPFPAWEPRLEGVAAWHAGESPAEARARDAGRLVEEIVGDAVRFARRTVDGEAAPPDLLRRDRPDPVVRDAAERAETAVSGAFPGARLLEYHPVVSRRDGRFGVELAIGDDLPPEVYDPVARCVGAAWEREFADDGCWEASHGVLRLVGWFDRPPVAGLPPGADDEGSADTLLPCVGDSLAAVEIRVVPTTDPVATALAVAAAAEAGLDLAPARPAWVAGRHLPAWWVWGPVGVLPGGRNLAVPVPRELEDLWGDLDVRCWWVGGVAFVNAFDPVTRADHTPEGEDRELDRDAWRAAAAAVGARGVRGRTHEGREGVRWRFGPEGWTPDGLRRVLARVAGAATPATRDFEPWACVGFSAEGLWVDRTLTNP